MLAAEPQDNARFTVVGKLYKEHCGRCRAAAMNNASLKWPKSERPIKMRAAYASQSCAIVTKLAAATALLLLGADSATGAS